MAQTGTALFPVAGLDDLKGSAFQMLGNMMSDNFCALGGKKYISIAQQHSH